MRQNGSKGQAQPGEILSKGERERNKKGERMREEVKEGGREEGRKEEKKER
jgi:hypothetical protein